MLKKNFDNKRMGVMGLADIFFGIKIQRYYARTAMTESYYIKKVLKNMFHSIDCKPAKTLLEPNVHLIEYAHERSCGSR